MKVLHIGQLIGGLDIYVRNSITYSDQSLNFVIVHGKNDHNKPIYKNGHIVKEYKIELNRAPNIFKDLKGLIQCIYIIKKEKPDLIHCHSAKGGFIGRIAGFITQKKTFYTPHAFSFLSTQNKFKKNIFLFLERIARLNSYLLACSESEKVLGIQKVGYTPQKVLVWHNAVPDINIQESSFNTPKEKYICYIGRPSYQKNSLFLLDIIKKVVDKDDSISFYLLGVGYYSPDLEEMQKKIKELDIEKNIKIIPWLQQSECFNYIKKSLFYLTVSRYEGLPLSVLEAMSLGKAIIASDVVGNKDCVQNERNGYLLPLNSSIFASKILELVQNNDKRKYFESESRRIFLAEFQIEKQIHKLTYIYYH